MDLPPTSKKLHFLDQAGNSIDGPREWTPALIEVHDALQDWTHLRLTRQTGEPLPLSLRLMNGQIRAIANWPLSGTGHYRLSLCINDTKIEEQTFTIEPDRISKGSYLQLLEDLEIRLPAAIALGLQRNGALAGLKFLISGESTLAVEVARLRRAINGNIDRMGLAQVLHALAQDPHRILSTTTLWMPRDRARRPHPSLLVQALSRPQNVDESGLPLRVLDTRVEHSVDIYENRLVKVYYQQIALRLQRLIHILELKQNSTLVKEAQTLRSFLDTARRRATFLNEVTLPVYLPTKITMVLLNRPSYRAALEGYLEFHRNPTVYLEEPALESPLENLPHLYQVWGTLEVLKILLEVTGTLGYQVTQQQLARTGIDGVYIRLLPDGKPIVVLEHPMYKTKINLISERTYGRQGLFQSISFEQRPDIALEIMPANGPLHIYLFDPKYKLESERPEGNMGDKPGPKKEDIDKMHAYRDAIRDGEQQRIVQYAAIMYPGKHIYYGEGIEALEAYPGSELSLEVRLRDIFSVALLP